MEQFVEFWAGTLEKDERTPEMSWMEKVKRALQKVQKVSDLTIK